jgi:hypothetical protein
MPVKFFSKVKDPEISVILMFVFFVFCILVVFGEKIFKNKNRSIKLEVAEELRTERKIEEAEKIEKTYAESPKK